MDEIAPATSSTLESKESPSPSASGSFLPKSSAIEGGGSTLYVERLQTEMGITFNGGSAALPKKYLAFAAEAERGCELSALGTLAGGGNTCPYTRTGQRVMKKASPTSGLYPRPNGPSQGSPEVTASHSETSRTTSPPELEALP